MKLDTKTAAFVAEARPALPDALWAGSIGWACLAARLCLCRSGETCSHPPGGDQWDERYFRWPQQRNELLAAAERLSAQINVYFAPSLLRADSRTRQNAQPGRWLWTELDEGCRSDIADWARQNRAVLVASGTPGHHHLYLPLDRLYPPEQVGIMNRALGKLLGASTPGGQHAASVMRLPGTWNLKRLPRRKVRLLVRPDGFRGHGEDSLARLGLLVPDSAPELPGGQPVNAEDLPEPRRPARMDRRLRGFLEEQPAVGTRSGRTHALVAYALEQGKTDAEAVWLVAHFPPALDRGDERYQAARLISKLRPLHSHAGRACGTVGCPNAPAWHSQRPAATHTGPEPATEPKAQEETVRSEPEQEEPEPEPSAETAYPCLPDEFWESRPELAHIHQAARSRMVSPDAALAGCLARVSALTHYRHQLPPIVGGHTSLDLLVAVIAEPGFGKGGAMAVARELVPGCESEDGYRVRTVSLGSTEGMAGAYFEMVESEEEGKRLERYYNGVLFSCDEGSSYKALSERSGQTTSETIRAMFKGERLGNTYVGKSKQFQIPELHYRAAIVLALQPVHAHKLLSEWDAGTPLRFLWTSARDPAMPLQQPRWPGRLPWRPPATDKVRDPAHPSHDGRLPVRVSSSVAAEVRERHRAKHVGEWNPGRYDGHRDLVRLKVAALLGCLRTGRPEASREDWRLAGLVLDTSDAVRTRMLGDVASAEEQVRAGRIAFRADAAGAETAARIATESDIVRCAGVLQRACRKHEDGAARKQLRESLASRDRTAWFELALKHAEADGLLSQDDDGRWHAQ